jgi:hypothetical protein
MLWAWLNRPCDLVDAGFRCLRFSNVLQCRHGSPSTGEELGGVAETYFFSLCNPLRMVQLQGLYIGANDPATVLRTGTRGFLRVTQRVHRK